MMSSEQLERQTEQSRAEVEMTIDELRARLTPGQIVDEILSYARDGGRQFTSNLGRQVTNNPLPVVLIGAGLAWFLMGRDAMSTMGHGHDASRSDGHDSESAFNKAGERLGDAASKAGDAMHGAVGGVRHAAESAGSAMSDTAHKLGEKASSAYYSASSKMGQSAAELAQSATALEQKTMMAARDLINQVKDQPLVMVGIGLAMGAALGAAFPATELENRVLGDTADEVKREAKHAAAQQLDKAKDKAKHVAHQLVEDNVAVPGNGSERTGGAPTPPEHFG
jgi:ElaB/YqjD/DUF883 family membrane-anchored ribosome-binding protein